LDILKGCNHYESDYPAATPIAPGTLVTFTNIGEWENFREHSSWRCFCGLYSRGRPHVSMGYLQVTPSLNLSDSAIQIEEMESDYPPPCSRHQA
jgi:hypothetical protein